MPAHRLVGPVLAAALLVLAGLIALGGLIDLFAKPIKQQAVYSPPPGDPGVGLESFAALRLLGWPTPAPPPAPPPTEAANTASGDVSSQPANPAPVPASEGVEPTPVVRQYQDDDLARAVLATVNGARAGQGLPALSASGSLMTAAQGYAQLLTQLDTLSHDANGGLLVRVQASGYLGETLGEALWEGWESYAPSDVVTGWLDSPPHRAILLDAAYVDAGVGCYVLVTNGAFNTRCVLDVGG